MKDRENTRRILERTERLVDEIHKEQFAYAARPGGWEPHVNVYRYPRHYEIVVELAGVESSDLAVTMSDDRQLHIGGTRIWPDLQCGDEPCNRTTLLEIEDGPFARDIQLRKAVRSDRMKIEHKQGLVWIRLPLKEIDSA